MPEAADIRENEKGREKAFSCRFYEDADGKTVLWQQHLEIEYVNSIYQADIALACSVVLNTLFSAIERPYYKALTQERAT
jgi:hypothetical protein